MQVADVLANLEGAWMRDRPEPTLQKPMCGLKIIGRKIPQKVVATQFGRSVNTICNWNKGIGRPFDYEGPYPDTPEGNDRLMKATSSRRRAPIRSPTRTSLCEAFVLNSTFEICQTHDNLGQHICDNDYGIMLVERAALEMKRHEVKLFGEVL